MRQFNNNVGATTKLYPLSRTNFKIEYRDFGHFRKLRPHIVDKPKIEVRHLVVSGS